MIIAVIKYVGQYVSSLIFLWNIYNTILFLTTYANFLSHCKKNRYLIYVNKYNIDENSFVKKIKKNSLIYLL